MTIDEIRRQLDATPTANWPVVLRVDGKEVQIPSSNDVMIPTSGNMICVYRDGVFDIMDCRHVSIISKRHGGETLAN